MPQDMKSFATCILKTDWRCFNLVLLMKISSYPMLINKSIHTYASLKMMKRKWESWRCRKKTVLRYWFPSNRESWNMHVIWRLKSQALLRSQTWSWIFFSRYPLFFLENEWVRPTKIISLCLLKANLLQILTIATK